VRRFATPPVAVFVLLLLAAPARADVLDAIRLGGQLDLAYADKSAAVELNTLNAGGSAFDTYRLRLFAEATPVSRLDLFTQFFWSEATGAMAYGAYVSYAPLAGRDLHLMAGKLPWIIGTWGPRTYADENPLIASPLVYQYHTTFPFGGQVPDADALLAQAGNGQFGVSYYPGDNGGRGMPIVYDFCWDFGVVAAGSVSPLEYALGVYNGTPSSSQAGRDDNHGKSILARVGVQPVPNVRLGVSGAIGPYVPSDFEPALGGADAESFDQRLAMADLEVLYGRAELYAEAFWNRWETPTVGDLDTRGYYVEGRYALPIGVFVAARWNAIDFDEITNSLGESFSWDADVDRLDAGAGYRFSRDVIAKLTHQSNWLRYEDGRGDQRYDVVGAQLTLKF
jgi:hypothetical protein